MSRPILSRTGLPRLIAGFLLLAMPAAAQPVITYQHVITGLSSPVDIVNAGDGTNRLFIVEQGGTIRVWTGTTLRAAPFLNVSSLIAAGGEQGLLSLAFHPAYQSNGYFFIWYTNTAGAVTLARYRVSASDPNVADAGSGVVLLSLPKPGGFTNHNGADLNFGPDGYLYVATGDGGSGNDPFNLAQSGASLFGKMLRLNVNDFARTDSFYTIPADNPYTADPAVDDRIWALGLRNPFRWSFDRLTGDMWIGDVGQGAKEEVNFRSAGSTGGVNYGWKCFEGTIPTPGVNPPCTPPGAVHPLYEYDNPNDGLSAVTGGFVYRGTEYPALYGYYIATDVYSGTIYLIKSAGGNNWTVTTQASPRNFIVSFGEGEDGTLYAASLTADTVFKVVLSVPLPVTLSHFTARPLEGYNELQWTTAWEEATAAFHLEFSTDGRRFERAGTVKAGRTGGGNYVFRHSYPHFTTLYYRLAIEDTDGSVRYSTILSIRGNQREGIRIFPTYVQRGVVNIRSAQPVTNLRLVDSKGRLVLEKAFPAGPGTIALTLPRLAKGIYLLQVSGAGFTAHEKLVLAE